MVFESLDDAAKGLLVTTCGVLARAGADYVIVGGWVPVLRGDASGLRHPGTRDVDVLFSSPTSIAKGAQALLDADFRPSAKHEFQLLIPVQVADRQFVFNVDLMHQGEAQESPDLFADILELGVPDAYDPTGKRWLKSIIFPTAAIIFEEHLWSPIAVNERNIEGSLVSMSVPLMDEVGLVLSKCESVKQKKRPRDAFDLLYVLTGKEAQSIVNRLTNMCKHSTEIAQLMLGLRQWIDAHGDEFSGKVGLYHESAAADAPMKIVSALDLMLK